MGLDAVLVLAVLAGLVLLLIGEWLRADLAAMIALAVLILTGLLPTDRALAGFSNPATVTVACMFVLSAGLQASGLVRYLGDRLLVHGPSSAGGLLLLIGLVIAPLSAFINNTAAVAVLLPVVLRACQGKGLSPSPLLMPMAFMAILGGTCTLIGTSTNILTSSLAAERGVRPFGMFEFSHLGLVYLAVGMLYLLLVGRRLLPERIRAGEPTERFGLARYLSELTVLAGSPWIGRDPRRVDLGEGAAIAILGTARGDRILPVGDGSVRLAAGDILLVKGSPGALIRAARGPGIENRPASPAAPTEIATPDARFVEAVVTRRSPFIGQTLTQLDLRGRFGVTVVALRRRGHDPLERIGKIAIREGDEFLLLVPKKSAPRIGPAEGLLLLQEVEVTSPRPWRVLIAATIVAAVIATAAVGLYPVSVAALAGCVAMVLSGGLTLNAAYRAIEWRVIVLLGAVIPLGSAIDSTGAGAWLAHGMLWLLADGGPSMVLAGFVLVTYLLTGFMSNTATAALMVPLVLQSAETMGVDSRPFLLGVMFAASAAFYTPVGYQTNLLVYGPGGYRFGDYLRAGGPLNLIYLVMTPLLIPRLFPF